MAELVLQKFEKAMALQKQHTLHTIAGKEQWVLIFGGGVLAFISHVQDLGQMNECVSQERNTKDYSCRLWKFRFQDSRMNSMSDSIRTAACTQV